jgi:hypothetical protein
MINRRSVPALHRACLHLHHQPETGKSGREFSCKPIENGHDSVSDRRVMAECVTPAALLAMGKPAFRAGFAASSYSKPQVG